MRIFTKQKQLNAKKEKNEPDIRLLYKITTKFRKIISELHQFSKDNSSRLNY